MAVSHEDIQELKKVFDDRYVRIEDCDATQREINDKFAIDDKRIDLILAEQKSMRSETRSGLKFNNWLTASVLGAIVAAVISFYFLG